MGRRCRRGGPGWWSSGGRRWRAARRRHPEGQRVAEGDEGRRMAACPAAGIQQGRVGHSGGGQGGFDGGPRETGSAMKWVVGLGVGVVEGRSLAVLADCDLTSPSWQPGPAASRPLVRRDRSPCKDAPRDHSDIGQDRDCQAPCGQRPAGQARPTPLAGRRRAARAVVHQVGAQDSTGTATTAGGAARRESTRGGQHTHAGPKTATHTRGLSGGAQHQRAPDAHTRAGVTRQCQQTRALSVSSILSWHEALSCGWTRWMRRRGVDLSQSICP